MSPRVAVLATLDTKSEEVAFLRREVSAHGADVRVIDVGTGAAVQECEVPAAEVAAAGGRTLEEVRALPRDEAMASMGSGAGAQLLRWHAQGELDGVLAIGGNQGTAIASAAMRALPIGPAKLIVSTVASGNVRGYVGDSDIAMQFSVADFLGGPNIVTTAVLRKAAAGIVAMAAAAAGGDPVAAAGGDPVASRPAVSITAFGNTEQGVTAAIGELRAAGLEVVPFHASGACGSAMERLVDAGRISAVLDLTIHEVLGELEPSDIYAPVRPGRLGAAGRQGVPQVVAPGGLEYFCFGAVEAIPVQYRDRATHVHNPHNTNVRTSADELARVGELVAERLNAASGPVAVMIPARGWSHVGSPGGVLHDLEANAAFVEVLRERLRPGIGLDVVDATINDPEFAIAAARRLVQLAPDLVPPVARSNDRTSTTTGG